MRFMRTGEPTTHNNYLHYHNGTTCHGHPTRETCEEDAIKSGWQGRVLEREDVDSIGMTHRCYSLIASNFPHWAKFGRFLSEIRLVATPLDDRISHDEASTNATHQSLVDEIAPAPLALAEVRAVVERSRDAATSPGERLVAALVGPVETLLAALGDRTGDPLERHRATTEAIVALDALGVRVPQSMRDRIATRGGD